MVITPADDDVPPASVVKLASAVVPPTMPPKVVAPLLLAMRAFAPFTVPVKLIGPAPALTVVAPASVLAPPAVKPVLV